ncbi:MAG: multicopper oxidase domain-containing protein [Streptosporangiales bacterium]|nr:multicopper oxidase domain-containing protein [Streptosporangiales bacterium]
MGRSAPGVGSAGGGVGFDGNAGDRLGDWSGRPPANGGYPVTGDQPLREPPALTSNNGALAVSLTAAPGAAVAGQAGAGLGFNGGSPGPTLRVRPGDFLRVRLINHLHSPQTCTPTGCTCSRSATATTRSW